MYVLAQFAPAAGCALMMVVCLGAMGGMSAGSRWRARLAPGDERSGDPVEGLRREIESLKEALEARDRSGAQS